MTNSLNSLWGDEFELPTTQEVIKKVKAKKQTVQKTDEQKLKSKTIDIQEKLDVITKNVYRVLGSYASSTVVIYTKEDFVKYIDYAISVGAIAVDTETNNSLDPTTCKLMGLCLYTEGQKNAYIPINHVDPYTGERLSPQLTEEDVKEQLSRLGKTTVIMHNAPFDYQVIGFTCGLWMHVDWDTRAAAKTLNENESAKLKDQYVSKIDPSIEKYNINSFFESIEYAIVPPSVFSLYAATDAYMTYKLYKYQLNLFSLNENKELFNLFKTVEMPIDIVAADMERLGVCIDMDYVSRLQRVYEERLDAADAEVNEAVKLLEPQIKQWRLTKEANIKPKKAKITKNGEEYGKSKNEQLADPINLSSNTQLAILMYDVLQLPVVNKEKPRGTDNDIMTELVKKHGFALGEKILYRRGLYKIYSTYVLAIPKQISPRDNRLHAKFDTNGTDTGRLSSSEPNLQNIPSSEKTIRLMFIPTHGYSIVGGDFSLNNAG